MPTDFMSQIMQQPLWLQLWVTWMGLVNLASLAFLRRREARVVLGAFAGAFILMQILFAANGYDRLLGLGHVVFWTPLLIYLVPRLPKIESSTTYGRWLRIVVLTNGLSLVIDYLDVFRYVAGDRS